VRPRQHAGDEGNPHSKCSELLVAGIPLPRYRDLRMGLPAVSRLIRLWRRQRPDIVHIVTEGPLGCAALLVARRLRIPVSSSFHTNFHTYSQHYGLGLLRPLVAGYLRRVHNAAACTLVPTHQLKDQLAREGYRNLIVVARGADTRLFNPARRSSALRVSWGLADGDLAVIYVGRLAAEKNMPLLLSAFDALKLRQPHARLILVGDGPLRREIEQRYPQHVFVGMRHGEDLAAHYASGDVFLFPSVTETFGNVTLEAMASGLAVVAYDYAAAHEHLVQGESGLLAPLHDGRAFQELAAQVSTDPMLRFRLQRNARLAAERIDWDEVVEHFESALRRQIEQLEIMHA
jgi:glycosyltransferase involved in cell wall biosynthesis